MKNKILISSVLFLFQMAAFAQQTSMGITAGSGPCWMSNTNQHVVYKQSYAIGVSFVYSTKTHWGLGADVKYSREGYKRTYDGTMANQSEKITERVNSDYIRVPLRVIYFFNDNTHNIRPNISLGPSFGFLAGGTIKNEYDNTVYAKTPVKDAYNTFDCGVQGSFGLNVKLREALWLGVDLAYYHGLIIQNTYGNRDIMNRNLTLNVSLRIGVGK